jgi:hypothetical protein
LKRDLLTKSLQAITLPTRWNKDLKIFRGKTKTQLTTVDVCVHATAGYINYAKELGESFGSTFFPGAEIRYLVFTDNIEELRRWILPERITVVGVEITHKPWPISTISRYNDYKNSSELLQSELVLFIDADMKIIGEVQSTFEPSQWPNEIALVRHPGFYRKGEIVRKGLSGFLPNRTEALGSWEDRSESQAYVSTRRRKHYVCGGVWMASPEAAIKLCSLLSTRIDADERSDVMAVWHDESHLNWWAANNRHAILSPEYCFVSRYSELDELTPRIEALDKPAEFVKQIKG